jgi:hypothetical protein
MFLQLALTASVLFSPSAPTITRDNNPLKGNIESLRNQNAVIDSLKIPRVRTYQDIRTFWEARKLSRVLDVLPGYYIHPSVDPETRFLRPEAKRYLECLGEIYYHNFRKQLKVTSLCRTEARQRQLRRAGISFANADNGEMQSAHMACTAFDVSINEMTPQEILFLSEYLVDDRASGKIDAFLEILSRHFHVTVFQKEPQGSLFF